MQKLGDYSLDSGKYWVVDDNAHVRNVLTCLLGISGFQVVTAEDGSLGLRTAEAGLPDLINTDIEMARLDGMRIIVRLRGQSRFSKVPILVISACGGRATDEALNAGVDEAMHKPVDFNSFIGCISQPLAA